jgi:hypothetical protein
MVAHCGKITTRLLQRAGVDESNAEAFWCSTSAFDWYFIHYR